jgi:chemosensory pili system protein ChpA (sensor histidine kinase/response regulator)
MNRTNRILLIAGAALIALAAGGYWQFVEVPARQAAIEARTAEEAAARAAAEEAARAAAAAEAARATEEAARAEAEQAERAAAEEAERAAAEEAERAAEEAARAEAAQAEWRAALLAALDPANLDADRMIAAIEQAGFDAAQADELKKLVRDAAGNPALLEAAAAQVRAALGL